MQGRAGQRVGQDRGKGRGLAGQRQGLGRAGQGGAGQDRADAGARAGAMSGQSMKARDNARGYALDDTGHSTLQDKAKDMIDCVAGWRSGRTTGQGK